MPEIILFKIENHVATITLNQPESLNAMNVEMGQRFRDILNEIEGNKDIRVVVLTGNGRAFSSGGNLEMLEEKIQKDKLSNARELKLFYQMFLGVRHLRVPVIAAINGHAVGAGFCVSLACDFRLASSKAKLGANFARIALAPGMGGTYFITRLAGITRAAEILLLGEVFPAQKAYEMNLLNEVLEPEDLLPRAYEIAGKIAKNGPLSVEIIKKGIQKAQHETLEELFEYDSISQARCFETDDIKEGIQAIREKRDPKFMGS